MKLSVITVLNTINYGSVLQTYATQLFFEEMGIDVEFIDYVRADQTMGHAIKSIIFSKRKNLKQ